MQTNQFLSGNTIYGKSQLQRSIQNVLSVDGLESDLQMNGHYINNLATCTTNLQSANKLYVDNAITQAQITPGQVTSLDKINNAHPLSATLDFTNTSNQVLVNTPTTNASAVTKLYSDNQLATSEQYARDYFASQQTQGNVASQQDVQDAAIGAVTQAGTNAQNYTQIYTAGNYAHLQTGNVSAGNIVSTGGDISFSEQAFYNPIDPYVGPQHHLYNLPSVDMSSTEWLEKSQPLSASQMQSEFCSTAQKNDIITSITNKNSIQDGSSQDASVAVVNTNLVEVTANSVPTVLITAPERIAGTGVMNSTTMLLQSARDPTVSQEADLQIYNSWEEGKADQNINIKAGYNLVVTENPLLLTYTPYKSILADNQSCSLQVGLNNGDSQLSFNPSASNNIGITANDKMGYDPTQNVQITEPTQFVSKTYVDNQTVTIPPLNLIPAPTGNFSIGNYGITCTKPNLGFDELIPYSVGVQIAQVYSQETVDAYNISQELKTTIDNEINAKTTSTVTSSNLIPTTGFLQSNYQSASTTLDQIPVATNSVNLNNQRITNLLNPVSAQDASTKFYTDQQDTSTLSASESYTNSQIATNNNNYYTKTQSDSNYLPLATRLDQINNPTASVSLNNQKLISVANPTVPTDGVNKQYVDSATAGSITQTQADARYYQNTVPLQSLVKATGSLDINNNKIINLSTPTLTTDATNKQYVDNGDSTTLSTAETFTTNSLVPYSTTTQMNSAISIGNSTTLSSAQTYTNNQISAIDHTYISTTNNNAKIQCVGNNEIDITVNNNLLGKIFQPTGQSTTPLGIQSLDKLQFQSALNSTSVYGSQSLSALPTLNTNGLYVSGQENSALNCQQLIQLNQGTAQLNLSAGHNNLVSGSQQNFTAVSADSALILSGGTPIQDPSVYCYSTAKATSLGTALPIQFTTKTGYTNTGIVVSDPNQFTPKTYVDTQVNTKQSQTQADARYYLNTTTLQNVMKPTGALLMNLQQIQQVQDGSVSNSVVGKGYVDLGDSNSVTTANTYTTNALVPYSTTTQADARYYLNTLPLQSITKATATLDLNTHSIINVVDPVNAQDVATKHYVDNSVVPVSQLAEWIALRAYHQLPATGSFYSNSNWNIQNSSLQGNISYNSTNGYITLQAGTYRTSIQLSSDVNPNGFSYLEAEIWDTTLNQPYYKTVFGSTYSDGYLSGMRGTSGDSQEISHIPNEIFTITSPITLGLKLMAQNNMSTAVALQLYWDVQKIVGANVLQSNAINLSKVIVDQGLNLGTNSLSTRTLISTTATNPLTLDLTSGLSIYSPSQIYLQLTPSNNQFQRFATTFIDKDLISNQQIAYYTSSQYNISSPVLISTSYNPQSNPSSLQLDGTLMTRASSVSTTPILSIIQTGSYYTGLSLNQCAIVQQNNVPNIFTKNSGGYDNTINAGNVMAYQNQFSFDLFCQQGITSKVFTVYVPGSSLKYKKNIRNYIPLEDIATVQPVIFQYDYNQCISNGLTTIEQSECDIDTQGFVAENIPQRYVITKSNGTITIDINSIEKDMMYYTFNQVSVLKQQIDSLVQRISALESK